MLILWAKSCLPSAASGRGRKRRGNLGGEVLRLTLPKLPTDYQKTYRYPKKCICLFPGPAGSPDKGVCALRKVGKISE